MGNDDRVILLKVLFVVQASVECGYVKHCRTS